MQNICCLLPNLSIKVKVIFYVFCGLRKNELKCTSCRAIEQVANPLKSHFLLNLINWDQQIMNELPWSWIHIENIWTSQIELDNGQHVWIEQTSLGTFDKDSVSTVFVFGRWNETTDQNCMTEKIKRFIFELNQQKR